MTDTTQTTGEWLTVPEVATILRCGRTAVYDHIRAGRLASTDIGAGTQRPALRVHRTDLDAFITARTQQARP